jgi:putative N6-adenine-specific DNA methylase
MLPNPEGIYDALVPCRAGLEKTVATELKAMGDVRDLQIGKRAVFFQTTLAGIYRINMALRSGISVLVPIRTFNARDYDLLYFQSRKTNWHKMFAVDKSVRIDVKGSSSVLRNTQYVVHRVKDGIVDTFRKLTEGQRPNIDKGDPDIHIVVYLDETRVTLCFDTSGLPLFKRGYRIQHGEAPIKEDLAAGMLLLSGWHPGLSLIDPLCGSGTFLFEAWMITTQTPPNLNRRFAFESLYGYNEEVHEAQKAVLRSQIRTVSGSQVFLGCEQDEATYAVAQSILKNSFPEADCIRFEHNSFQNWSHGLTDKAHFITNPPYGVRLGTEAEIRKLYGELSTWLQNNGLERFGGSLYSANPESLKYLKLKPTKALTLFNGALEGNLFLFQK